MPTCYNKHHIKGRLDSRPVCNNVIYRSHSMLRMKDDPAADLMNELPVFLLPQ